MKGLRSILDTSSNYLRGIAAAPGLVIGEVYLFRHETLLVDASPVEPEAGISAFNEALQKARKEISKILNLAREMLGEDKQGILEAQLMQLEDPMLIDAIIKRIQEEKISPEFIVDTEFQKIIEMMSRSGSIIMVERAHEMDEARKRIIRNLQHKKLTSKITPHSIVVSDELTPADTILFSRSDAKAFVTDHGGITSHAAIIARSLDIPAVIGLQEATGKIKNGDTLVVDGFNGYVFVNPTAEQLEFFKSKIEHLKVINEEMAGLRDKPAETLDGHTVKVMSNVDVSGEMDMVISRGSQGIGLYRTEQLIEELGEFPSEGEQIRLYSDLANRIYPEVLTLRTFDIGGDKFSVLDHKEANPFLGLRGVRFLLANPKLYKAQLRAMLVASKLKNVQIMIPMVSTFKEIIRSKALLEECKQELNYEGIEYDKSIKLGIMIEVPSAAVMIKDYASLVDFVSIGTNDLIQYLMAVDRGNDLVNSLYQEFHPAVLRALNEIIRGAKEAGAFVSMCGEMAGDTLAVPVLLGMGLDAFSVSPSLTPTIKRTVRSISFEACKNLVSKCCSLSDEEKIMNVIYQFFVDNKIQRTRQIL